LIAMLNPSPRRIRLRNLTLLLSSTMTVMAGATIAPSLPEMQHSFRARPHVELLVKLVMTVPGLFIALAAPLVGLALDRYRKKPIIVLALLLYAVAGTSGFFLSGSLHAILIGRALLGVAVAGIMTGCTTLIGDYFAGPQLSRFMGLQAAVGGFGGVVFLLAGGGLASLGWRYPFLIYLCAFLVLPAAWLFLYDPDKRLRALTTPQETRATPAAADALPLGMLASCYLLAVLEILCLYMIPVHYPFYASALEPVSAAQTGSAIATLLLVMAALSTQYRRLAERAGFVVLHGLGLLWLGGGYVLLASARSYAGTYPGLIVSGVGLGIMRPNLMVWLISFTPLALRGRVLGGVTTFFFLGQFLCPLVTEPSIARLGLAATFRIAGGASLLLGLAFLSTRLGLWHPQASRPQHD
jgi:MFS family permease